ncbi:MAG TPA: hypothetical protein VEX39_03325 [Thermoleophilaceae bacterium]|nr:hypothetical protein [Thermoleophilaceae bacterium]
MSSQTRNERGDESRLDLRTLAIASVASAVAAIVVSRFWTSGTPFAAAITPVLVTLFKEALDRPTAKIAEKVTVSARPLPQAEIREPAASRVGRDSQRDDEGPTRRLEPTRPAHPEADGDPSDIRVYRQQPARAGGLGRINPKIALITGLVAFVIAGVVLTAGQLAIGNPFGDDGNGAIILGGGKNSKKSREQNTTTEQQQTVPADQQQTTPQQTTPDDQQTAPVEPEQQQQQPQQQRAPTQTTPQNTTTTPSPGTVQP